MKQKSDKFQSRTDQLGHRGPSDPIAIGAHSMTLGIQGSQMLRQVEGFQNADNSRI